MKKIISISLLLLCSSVFAKNVVFDDNPIALDLALGQETIVHFPDQVIKLSIADKEVNQKLSILLTGTGVLYIKPKSEFEKSRAIATLATGQLILIDLAASKDAKYVDKLNITLPEKPTVNNNKVQIPTQMQNLPTFLKKSYVQSLNADGPKINYQTMTQFAMRHFTGPNRLIGDNLNSTKVGIGGISTSKLLRIWQDRLSFKPLEQWQINGQYVTAFLVKNKSSTTYDFDPRAIRGDFLFVGTLIRTIEPYGSVADQTIWVFISNKSFNEASRGGRL